MSVFDQLNEWLMTAMVASLVWVSGIVSAAHPQAADAPMPSDPGQFMLGWAQQVDQPPIEQVGEETSDVETLDEGAPPDGGVLTTDAIVLDAGPSGDDIELLDQGAPPVVGVQPVGTVPVAPVADPSTAYVAPAPSHAVASGPVLPEGFGTGRVVAIAGHSTVPPGLADCHVGAVTGRAYVGIDCGEDEGSQFVGHARSFDDFPFVVEGDFPFDGDEAFFTNPNFPFRDNDDVVFATRDDGDRTDVRVAAAGGSQRARDDEAPAPVIETSGAGTVEFAQRARDREPRVRVEDRSRRNRNRQSESAADANRGRTTAESRNQDGADDKDRRDRVKAESDEQQSKSKKDEKKKKKRAEAKKQRERAKDRR